jgi:hypothetical protein
MYRSHGEKPAAKGDTSVCRSIKTLRDDPGLTEEDVEAAALQYVRKVSGYRAPSQVNKPAFEAAVAEITRATQGLLDRLVSRQTA